MTLIQLRYLTAIVDAGLNITLAARELNTTQSGISKQLKTLEDELGFLIFVRRGKSLERLTTAGAQVLDHARTVLVEAANIRTVASNQRGDGQGELRIAATYTQARYVLPEPLARLGSRFPQVRLHLQPGGEQEALEQLELDRADLAVVSSPERPRGSDLAVPLYRWRLVGVTPRGRPIAPSGRSVGLADLAAQPLVTYQSSLEPSSSFARAFAAAGLTPHLACVSRDADLIKTFVRAGLGVGLLAEMAVGDQDADLDVMSLEGLFPVSTAWAVLRRERVPRAHVTDLLLALAPHLDRRDLKRALEGLGEPLPSPPLWSDLLPREPAHEPTRPQLAHA